MRRQTLRVRQLGFRIWSSGRVGLGPLTGGLDPSCPERDRQRESEAVAFRVHCLSFCLVWASFGGRLRLVVLKS